MFRKLTPIFSLILLMVVYLAFLTPVQGQAAQSTATIETRVATGNDDAEENAGTGGMYLNSSDLELIYGDGHDQVVGVRFQGLTIPQGSSITNAYIQFTVDEKSSTTTNLTIKGQKADDASGFSSTSHDISSRPTTAHQVDWNNVPAWGNINESGVKQQTPNLAAIVQEIVGRANWSSGNAMVFIITGSGKRVARSYNYSSSKAPLLHVEYTTNMVEVSVSQGSDDAEQRENWNGSMDLYSSDLDMVNDKLIGVRFQNVDVPQGAQITNAYIVVTSDEKNWSSAKMWIDIEDQDNPPTFSFNSNDISNRNWSGNHVRWKPVPKFRKIHKTYQTPDLTALVQQVVGRAGWQAGNAMAFLFEGYRGTRAMESYDGEPTMPPKLHIEYAEGQIGTDQPTITVDNTTLGDTAYQGTSPNDAVIALSDTGPGKLSYTVTDDATWLTVSPTSGNLDPGDATNLTVSYSTSGLAAGTYSATITIADANATNNPVEIAVSVTIEEVPEDLSCGHVPLYTENLVSPAILILLDVSGSMRTKMDVGPQEKPRTPDLSAIVQEIVNRPGWQSDNAMAFIIEGSGRRTAVSYNQDSGRAPLLHVGYIDPADGLNYELDRRVAKGSDDAEERISNASVNLNSSDLELIHDNGGGDQVVGLRFQNVALPAGATITSAYIEFEIDESDSQTTNLTVYGEDMDNPPTFANNGSKISGRTKTTAAVAWNNIAEWSGVTQKSRIDIGKETISDLVKDRSIAWGYGTWCNRNPWSHIDDRTRIFEGTKPNTDEHQQALQDAIAATTVGGGTPFSYSIDAATNYFTLQKRDKDGSGDLYVQSDCQPKFLIEITDGQGNSGSTVATTETATNALADAGVSAIGVGFGLNKDESDQLYKMAEVANDRGNASDTDDLYGLNQVDGNGAAQPFFAYNKQELVDALDTITESVKGAIFHGSAPAPTTSVDLEDMVIVAKFDAARWSGDVDAIVKDTDSNSPTFGLWVTKKWSAMDKLPATRSVWTVDPASPGTVVPYTDATLANDKYQCNLDTKPIGDIVNSTPVVVGTPPFWYPFDNYAYFASSLTGSNARDAMVYIGANDGSLHAFDLETGVERWAFIPASMQSKLDAAAGDPLYDRCAPEYCHQYYVDGSPIVGDVYAEFNGVSKQWRTVLIEGEREGGEAYFALDVTGGKPFNYADPTQATQLLWEFTDDQLGQTWSEPSIDRVAISGGSRTATAWGVYFGSGYITPADQQANKEAYLYGILAHDGSDLWLDDQGAAIHRVKIAPYSWLNYDKEKNGGFSAGMVITGDQSGATATVVAVDTGAKSLKLKNVSGVFQDKEKLRDNGIEYGQVKGTLSSGQLLNDALASPLVVDLEGDHVADRLYVGNLYGNMYRVDDIGQDMTPQVSTLFTFDGTSPNINPVRAKAEFAYGENPGDIWLYFGTGRYETQVDKTDDHRQFFFGLKDNATTPVATYHEADLVELSAKFLTTTVNGEAKTVRYVDGTNTLALPWKMRLMTTADNWGGPAAAGSERVITQPLVVGGIVLFTTFIPDENVCAGAGESWVFALDYQTGLPPEEPVFDLNNDGQFDENDMVDLNGVKIVPVAIKVGRGKGSHPVLHKNTLFITTTGDGDDGGGSGNGQEDFFAKQINVPQQKVTLNSWRQN